MMDREEARLRRSPFLVRDHDLKAYVTTVACRLAGEHCANLRVYVVHTPMFNASMAPNGMLQIWSGLLLRLENEAQLAAVLGHEIGHYLERHSLDRLRDAKARSGFAAFLGAFGLLGAVGQLATVAGLYANSREQEHAADRIGVALMKRAGYDPREAARVWTNLHLELKADPAREPEKNSPMFATHPLIGDRSRALGELGAASAGGEQGVEPYRRWTAPHRADWLDDEVRRGAPLESIALMTRMLDNDPGHADVLVARGEVRRLQGGAGALDLAIADYRSATVLPAPPPQAWRGLGLCYRAQGEGARARTAFQEYLLRAPLAADAHLVRSYLEES